MANTTGTEGVELMCFSATASFTAGIPLAAVGAITITKVQRKAELPFATIPLLFGIQQMTEGALWLTFEFNTLLLNQILTNFYSLFSHVLWPIFIPFAIQLLEPTFWRRRLLHIFQLAGVFVGVYLLYFLVAEPIVSQIENKSIVYESPHFYVLLVMALYFAATGVSCLVSSHRIVQILGLLILGSALLAYEIKALSFVSVWCFFAAILSFVVFLYFQRGNREIMVREGSV